MASTKKKDEAQDWRGEIVISDDPSLPTPDRFLKAQAGVSFTKLFKFSIPGTKGQWAICWIDLNDVEHVAGEIRKLWPSLVDTFVVEGLTRVLQNTTNASWIAQHWADVENLQSGNAILATLAEKVKDVGLQKPPTESQPSPSELRKKEAARKAEKARIAAAVEAGEMTAAEALTAFMALD